MRSSARLLALLVGTALCGPALADDQAPALANPMREAVDNDPPRVTRNDSLTESQRAMPGYRNESTEFNYRWWKSAGRADLGLGLGTLSLGARPTGSVPGLGGDAGAIVLATGTVMTLGMRYRTSDRSAVYADASRLHGNGFGGNDAVVGKVGIEFKSAQSRFNVNYGGLGLRLAGDTRMTLRVKRGGLGIFMRSTF